MPVQVDDPGLDDCVFAASLHGASPGWSGDAYWRWRCCGLTARREDWRSLYARGPSRFSLGLSGEGPRWVVPPVAIVWVSHKGGDDPRLGIWVEDLALELDIASLAASEDSRPHSRSQTPNHRRKARP